MSVTNLTPQERFKLTVTHKQPDRPPVNIWPTPEISAKLEDHFERRLGDCSIERALEIDFRGVNPISIAAATAPCKPLSVMKTTTEAGIYQDVVSKPLAWIKTLEDVERYVPGNDPKAFDFSGILEACRAARPFVRIFGNYGIFDIVNGLGARGMGIEDLLSGMMSGDPVILALIEKHLDYDFRYCQAGMEAGNGEIELLAIGEDCGHQHAPIFPPTFFKSFFAPRLKRFTDLAHHHGASCIMHSCGSVREIIPILIEDVGLDILQACQPEAKGMEPAGLKRDFGDRITLSGMLGLQKTLTNGTVEECRREAERLVTVIGKDGGYIFEPTNSVTKDVPLENVLTVYEVATGKNLL
jgi:uroporphyrinogen decarboxylase